MKKIIRIIVAIIFVSCIMPIQTSAQEDITFIKYEASGYRRVQVVECPQCNKGLIRKEVVKTTNTFAHYEAFPCSHNTHTYDIYKVYEVKGYARCNNCGYELLITQTENHVYDHCSNSLPR